MLLSVTKADFIHTLYSAYSTNGSNAVFMNQWSKWRKMLIKSVISKNNRLGGGRLTPSYHTTVRTDPYPAFRSFPAIDVSVLLGNFIHGFFSFEVCRLIWLNNLNGLMCSICSVRVFWSSKKYYTMREDVCIQLSINPLFLWSIYTVTFRFSRIAHCWWISARLISNTWRLDIQPLGYFCYNPICMATHRRQQGFYHVQTVYSVIYNAIVWIFLYKPLDVHNGLIIIGWSQMGSS